jgi:glutamyl-tRNA reductase
LRERLAASGAIQALESLSAAGFPEAVVLATCNRFEAYVPNSAGAPARLTAWMDAFSREPLADRAYRVRGEAAVRHLFEVASGLDSLVLGESDILGQVKQAYQLSRESGRSGKLSNLLFQRALFVGKEVRAKTRIGLGLVSAASVAVELARRMFGRLSESEVLILGAGRMAEAAALHLREARVGRLRVANRTYEKAAALAERLGGEPAPWEEIPSLLPRTDIVIASTGASEPVLSREEVDRAMTVRGRPLFLIDISMPRAVEESAGGLDGVHLYTLSDFESIAAENASRRLGEIEAARAIAAREASEFSAWLGRAMRGERLTLRRSPPRDPSRESRVLALA